MTDRPFWAQLLTSGNGTTFLTGIVRFGCGCKVIRFHPGTALRIAGEVNYFCADRFILLNR